MRCWTRVVPGWCIYKDRVIRTFVFVSLVPASPSPLHAITLLDAQLIMKSAIVVGTLAAAASASPALARRQYETYKPLVTSVRRFIVDVSIDAADVTLYRRHSKKTSPKRTCWRVLRLFWILPTPILVGPGSLAAEDTMVS